MLEEEQQRRFESGVMTVFRGERGGNTVLGDDENRIPVLFVKKSEPRGLDQSSRVQNEYQILVCTLPHTKNEGKKCENIPKI
jgi:hypothetical protein